MLGRANDFKKNGISNLIEFIIGEGFEFLTVVILKVEVFRDVTACRMVNN